MIALYIIAAIVLLFLLILFLRINVVLINDGEMSVLLKLLFIKIKLAPKKKKTPKLSDFKIKKFRKRRLKEEKKLRAKQKKKDKKSQKKAEKESQKQETEEEKQSLKEKVGFGLDLVRYVIAKAISKFGKHLRIEIRRLAITVSGDDPARVAVTYGYVCQAVAYIVELADNNLNTKYPKGRQGSVSVGVDYVSGKSSAEIDITLGIRVWQVLSVLIAALKGYILDMPSKKSGKKETDKKETDNKDEAQNKNKKRNPAKAGTEV